jgi:hypothetical protein
VARDEDLQLLPFLAAKQEHDESKTRRSDQ